MHSLLSKAGLPAVGIFSELSADERAALMAELETRALKRGDVLVRQGDAADALYIVISGRFAVTLEGRRDPLTEIGPEQPIGEIAFLTGGTRTATVSAMRDSLVLRLGRNEFERISAKCPGIWRTLTTALSQRLAATTAHEPADARSAPAHHCRHSRRRLADRRGVSRPARQRVLRQRQYAGAGWSPRRRVAARRA